jgi:hypothetical protein
VYHSRARKNQEAVEEKFSLEPGQMTMDLHGSENNYLRVFTADRVRRPGISQRGVSLSVSDP